jgi:hypothetical protein
VGELALFQIEGCEQPVGRATEVLNLVSGHGNLLSYEVNGARRIKFSDHVYNGIRVGAKLTDSDKPTKFHETSYGMDTESFQSPTVATKPIPPAR